MKEKFLTWIQGSLDNSPGGASSKKLSAFWALVVLTSITQFTWMVWAYKHDNWDLLEWVLTADLMFAGTALGINSIEKIKGKSNNESSPQ
jgi:hypothetical protein